jgi:hypothetical protein
VRSKALSLQDLPVITETGVSASGSVADTSACAAMGVSNTGDDDDEDEDEIDAMPFPSLTVPFGGQRADSFLIE